MKTLRLYNGEGVNDVLKIKHLTQKPGGFVFLGKEKISLCV